MVLGLMDIYEWLCDRNISAKADIQINERSIRRGRLWSGERDLQTDTAYVREEGAYCAIMHCNGKIELKSTSVHDGINILLECMDLFACWEKAMLLLIPEKNSLNKMLKVSADLLPYPILICNKRTKVLAISALNGQDAPAEFAYASQNGSMPLAGTEGMANRKDASTIYSSKNAQFITDQNGNAQKMRANIWLNGMLAGALIAYSGGKSFKYGDLHRMDFLCRHIEKFAAINSQRFISDFILGDFLTGAVGGESPDENIIQSILDYMGWKVRDTYAVLRIEQKIKSKAIYYLLRLGDEIEERLRECYVTSDEEGIAVLVNVSRLTKGVDYMKAIGKMLSKETYVLGLSYAFDNILDYADYFEQAVTAAMYARRSAGVAMTMASDIAIKEIARLAQSHQPLRTFIHTDVSRLKQYDEKNGSELLKTLFYYLFSGCNHSESANSLGIHRNTMKYRIDKITELLYINPAEENNRLLLLVSCTLILFADIS